MSGKPTEESVRNDGAIPTLDMVLKNVAETTKDVKFSGVFASNDVADAVIAVADASGGATAAALTVDLKSTDSAGTALAKVKVLKIVCADTQYAGSGDANANVTFATATKGSILASGSGYAVVKTDAAGQFACTASNASDETVWFSCATIDGGLDALTAGVTIRGCIPDSATWAA